ncbi:MAG: hypothetical protein ACD_12C00763G0001 [uncultured bacterium]|nr:MAG: hypothetical protein ACD_12C00763G0001 [uncultured bacterium]
MDDFAKEYFDKIKKIAPDFYTRRKELAGSRIKMLVACLYRQLTVFSERYDLILGSGNSGLFMTKIAAMTYESLNIKQPLIVNLPIYRFMEDEKTVNNNLLLLPQLHEKLKNVEPINNILFIDDEIMKGITAKIYLDLIIKINPKITHLNITIIAENHFFEWHYKIPQVSMRFFGYAPLIQGLNGNIGHFITEDLYKSLSQIFPSPFSYNHAMAIVIGGGIKQRDSEKNQFFNFAVDSIIKEKVPDYQTQKKLLLERLKVLVNEGIEKYKSRKIKFRF